MTYSLLEKTDNAIVAPYFHLHVGEVDVKVKIVAIGQASEAVSIFCTQRGYGNGRLALDATSESQAQNLLEIIRQEFASDDYKCIPLLSQSYAGIKIHRACQNYSWASRRFAKQASDDSMEIFVAVRQIAETLAQNPHALQPQGRNSRHSFHNRMAEQTLRNEISRIIGSASQMESKINSIVRLIDKHAVN